MSEWKIIFKEKDIELIQCQFTTLFGDVKMVEFPVTIWDDMAEGTGVDGSSLGFLKTNQSDMVAKPDFHTFAVLPWNSKVGRFICDMEDYEGHPHPADPRSMLKRVINDAKNMGYELYTRPELEWYYVRDLESGAPVDHGKYMDTIPFDPYADLRRTTALTAQTFGISVKTVHHECGPGQQEIEMGAVSALKQADDFQTLKLITKKLAQHEGLIATYLPKPYLEFAGSGLHIHNILMNEKKENIFAENGRTVCDNLRWFIGGILDHVDGITAFLNPLTNSYKRLVPGHEAPVYKAWGVANRTALIRIPGYEKKARFEYRAADAGTNIYIAETLLLAAGLDGLKRKVEPVSAPTTANVEHLSPEERKKLNIGQLPGTLKDALDKLESDNFVKSVIGKEAVEIFLEKKRQEWQEYSEAKKAGPSAEMRWEYDRYLVRV